MKRSKATADDLQRLRDALAALRPGAAHQAQTPPSPASIFTPTLHANALDPQRALVIGNRGVGKSFWSSVLTHEDTRNAVAPNYPRVPLKQIRAVLGFHEDAGKDDGPAPSAAVLASLLKSGVEAETIWRAVLFRALRDWITQDIPLSLAEVVRWMQADIENSERLLREIDATFTANNEIFVVVFDALDRLGRDWDVITPLSQGILRLSLDMRGFRSLRPKIFMRTDQSKDNALFRFADASKIRSDAVNLTWRKAELFGLLFKILASENAPKSALLHLTGYENESLIDELENDETMQEAVFYRVAGEYMGAGPKRGRTYNWIYDHLSDTFGETSPRSFITAIQRAAQYRPAPKSTVIDNAGIRAGVQEASTVRVQQLKEDYDWIDKVLGALHGLEVPCEPSIFTRRWKDANIVEEVRSEARLQSRLLPLELIDEKVIAEQALLLALANIGVVEFRTEKRINVPDIFRVEAGLKRRGGVRPPQR